MKSALLWAKFHVTALLDCRERKHVKNKGDSGQTYLYLEEVLWRTIDLLEGLLPGLRYSLHLASARSVSAVSET